MRGDILMSEEPKFQHLSHQMTPSSDTPLYISLPYLKCYQLGIIGSSMFTVPGIMPRVPIMPVPILLLRPQPLLWIQNLGGITSFSAWWRAILSDSGSCGV